MTRRPRDAFAKGAWICQLTEVIPRVAHFIWFGSRLPWLHCIALRSAARVGGFSRIVLHHDAPLCSLTDQPLSALPGFESRRIEPQPLLASVGVDPRGLCRLYERLDTPAARANLLRVALLAAEGGVYLDMDTVTLGSFEPLLANRAFCGLERVAFPAAVVQGTDPLAWARAYALSALRELMRRLPDGPTRFRKLAHWYPLAPNNAVLGAVPGHPLMLGLLEAMLRMDRSRQLARYALGTHLLQTLIPGFASEELGLYPPEWFYPLGPELSEHWFRLHAAIDLSTAITTQTRLVHWYASVRTRKLVPLFDPKYVREHAPRQLLSALIASYA